MNFWIQYIINVFLVIVMVALIANDETTKRRLRKVEEHIEDLEEGWEPGEYERGVNMNESLLIELFLKTLTLLLDLIGPEKARELANGHIDEWEAARAPSTIAFEKKFGEKL